MTVSASNVLRQTHSKVGVDTQVEIFIVVREVLCNNYQSRNLIGPYHFWEGAQELGKRMRLQWNPSMMDTIGDQHFVRCSEVSLTQELPVYFR